MTYKIDKKCKNCEDMFMPKVWNAKFCSTVCKSRYTQRAYYSNNKDIVLKRAAEYYKLNRTEIIARVIDYDQKRIKADLDYKLKRYLRSRLYNALKGNYKSGSAVSDLGCSIEFLKQHLEAQFTTGMNWDNYGSWHIDHIEPLTAFNLSDRCDLLKVCNYTNLQPLWAEDNISKGGVTIE